MTDQLFCFPSFSFVKEERRIDDASTSTNNNSAYVILIDIKNVVSVHNNQSEELNKSIQMSFNRKLYDSVNKISKHDALIYVHNS